MRDTVLSIHRTDLSPEVLVVDATANLAALSALALAGALGVSLIVAVTIASGDGISGRQRWTLAAAWGASTLVAVAAAAPAGQWGIPIAAALTLPVLTVLGRTVRQRLRQWDTQEQQQPSRDGLHSDPAKPTSRPDPAE